jgi:hypothetical protein
MTNEKKQSGQDILKYFEQFPNFIGGGASIISGELKSITIKISDEDISKIPETYQGVKVEILTNQK